MTITTDLIEAYLKCSTKCFLLPREVVGTGVVCSSPWMILPARVHHCRTSREGD